MIPEDKNSDHPGDHLQGNVDLGPQWVASVANAVGQSGYWDSSVVVVIWDDWGGFYDNAKPPFQDNYGGLGFRVPMLVISPYDRTGSGKNGGFVSHTQYEFGSILKYIEDTFSLGSLGTTDVRATSIGNVFELQSKAAGLPCDSILVTRTRIFQGAQRQAAIWRSQRWPRLAEHPVM